MKLLNTLKSAFAFINMFFIVATSCTAKNKNPETQAVSLEIAAEVQPDEKDKSIEVQKTLEQKETTTKDSKDEKQVDPDKIYEQGAVKEAVSSFNNPQLVDFFQENFKYPNDLKVEGVITADLIIEKDGSISDVVIVKAVHPALDKEAVRVLSLMPKFTPGKKEGKPVRSKFRMPVVCRLKK